MYQILIADDELSLREGLVNFIDWDSLNCHVAYAAENGSAAIQYLTENAVDIVITDIRMPVKNGLDVAEYIKAESLSTKVIILSGYSDFQYAQTALQLGVVDFILKDNPLEKIKDAVRKATGLIEQQQKNQEALEEMRRSFAEEKEDLRIKFFMDLINNIPLKPEILEKKMATLSTPERNVLCILFQIRQTQPGQEVKSTFINAVITCATKIFSPWQPTVFPVKHHQILMILQPMALIDEHHLEVHLKKIFDLTQDFSEYQIRIAISTIHNNIMDLHKSYAECTYCLKHHTTDRKRLLFYHDETITTVYDENPLISKALLYIEQYCHESLSLQDIAAHVGLNPSYFSRIFKQITGDSVTTCITKYRISKAKELLADDSMRLSEIAEGTGFNDVSYFSNTFKKMTGYTPSDYRALLLQEKELK